MVSTRFIRYNITVIYEVNCVLLRKKRKFKNFAVFLNFDLTSEVHPPFHQGGGMFSIKRQLLANQRRKISQYIEGVLFLIVPFTKEEVEVQKKVPICPSTLYPNF